MNDSYDFIDFLSKNEISYRKREIEFLEDHPEYENLVREKEQDKEQLTPEDFFEKYFDEIANLNGYEDIFLFEEYLRTSLRQFRDRVHRKEFIIDPANKADTVIKLQNSLKTLEFYESSFVSSEVKKSETLEEGQTLGDEEEDEAFIVHHNLANLQYYISPKISAIKEVLKCLNVESDVSTSPKKDYLKPDLTLKQTIILLYYLRQQGCFSKSTNQTDFTKSVSELTGYSFKNLRQTFSKYKSFKTKEASGIDFPETDHNKVRNLLNRIVEELKPTTKK